MQSIILLTNENKQVEEFLKKNFFPEDIITSLYPEKTEYRIDQIRAFQKEVKYFNPKRRVYVLYDFNHSSLEAQNAFLKLLEEPPENVNFVLVSESFYQLVPTIVSRAKVIDLKNKTKKIDNQKIEKIISKLKDNQLFFLEIADQEEAANLILSIIYYFAQQIKKEFKSYQILKESIKNLYFLQNNNLNPQITLDNLLIFIHKCYNENINE
jgi:DNA polymerase III delta prime subunit